MKKENSYNSRSSTKRSAKSSASAFVLLLILFLLPLDANSSNSLRFDSRHRGIDIYSNGKTFLLPLAYIPSGIATDARAERIYVADPSGFLEVYDSVSRLLIARVSIPKQVSAMAASASDSGLFLSSKKEIFLIDVATFRTVLRKDMGSTIAALSLDSKAGKLFVATVSGSILALNPATLVSLQSYSDPEMRPLEIAFSSSYSKLYVRLRNSISVFDSNRMSWEKDLDLEGLPRSIRINSDGTMLFVELSNEKSIAVFDIADDSLADWYSIDKKVNGQAIDSDRWHLDSVMHFFTMDGAEVTPLQLKESTRMQNGEGAITDAVSADAEMDLSSTSGSKDFLSFDVDSGGSFIGSWTNLDGSDGGGEGVYGREYNSNGSADKKEFVVNSKTGGDQGNSAVAAASNGDYVIVWRDSEGNDGDSLGVFFKRFSNGGNPKDSADQKVANTTGGGQRMISVDTQPDGDFVTTWTGPSDGKKAVFVRRFASNGSPQGNEQVVDLSNDSEWAPDIATNSSGRSAVVWRDGQDNLLRARVYEGSGNPVGGVFKVGTTSNAQFAPSIGMDDAGNFAIAWQENAANSILYRIFSSNGNPKSGPQKASQVGDKDYAPSISVAPNGKFCIAWRDDSLTLWARSFDSQGNPDGGEFKPSTSAGDQLSPACAMDKDGDFLVAWKARGGNGNSVVKGRKFTPGGGGGGGGDLTIDCTADPESGDAPLDVNFTATASGGDGTFDYEWDFGDGSDVTDEKNPSHEYTDTGKFDAKVTVTSGSETASCKKTIDVGGDGGGGGGKLKLDCTADPKSGEAPLKVKFTADASGGDGNFQYEWNFGDGSATSDEKSPKHKYENAGNFDAKVTVTSGSETASCKKKIDVGGDGGGGGGKLKIDCTADPTSGEAPLKVKFTADASGGDGGFVYEWNFGDGSPTTDEKDPKYKYLESGQFEAKVTVTSGSDTASCKKTIDVAGTGGGDGGKLKIDCTADKASGDAPLKVKFTADASGGDGNFVYEWNFGDGSAPTDEKDPKHKYTDPGKFKAKVTVTSGSDTASCKKTIDVGGSSARASQR